MQGFIDCIAIFLCAVVMSYHFGFWKPSNFLFSSGYQVVYIMMFEVNFYILTKSVPMQVQIFCQPLSNIYVLFTNICVNNYFLMAV